MVFDHTATGTYAVEAYYYDENANGQHDVDFLAYPVEGISTIERHLPEMRLCPSRRRHG